VHAQRNFGAPLELASCSLLRWSYHLIYCGYFFFVTVHNCLHIIEYYYNIVIIVTLILCITHYLYVYVDFVEFVGSTLLQNLHYVEIFCNCLKNNCRYIYMYHILTYHIY
jgi:hypothetical protein